MKKNQMEKIVFWVFAIVGVIFTVVGIIWLCHSFHISGQTLKTEGIISEIESYRAADGDTDFVVYVSYEAEGESFKDVPLSFYSSSMRRGNTITIYYLPDNPGNPYSMGTLWFGPAVFSGIGIIFLIIGMVGIVIGASQGRRIKQLKESGISLYATVEEIYMNMNYRVNGRHPYVIICTYTDDYTGTTYRFKSGNIWEDPGYVYPVGSSVKVLVKPEDYGTYCVDVENI